MRRTLWTCILSLFIFTGLTAQKKSDLLMEINQLKSKLDSTQSLVKDAKNQERMSMSQTESFREQVAELQTANATLLQNLNSFAQVSNKNSENINRTLASLDEKERQLKFIREAIAQNDSTAILVLTRAKQSLGENAKISVSEGAVTIMSDLTFLFGDTAGSKLSDSAGSWLGNIATILKSHPEMALTIEGLSMTGQLDLAALQAAAVSTSLQNTHQIAAERILALARDGNFKEGINLKIHPKFQQFYLMVREKMKNNPKQ